MAEPMGTWQGVFHGLGFSFIPETLGCDSLALYCSAASAKAHRDSLLPGSLPRLDLPTQPKKAGQGLLPSVTPSLRKTLMDEVFIS